MERGSNIIAMVLLDSSTDDVMVCMCRGMYTCL